MLDGATMHITVLQTTGDVWGSGSIKNLKRWIHYIFFSCYLAQQDTHLVPPAAFDKRSHSQPQVELGVVHPHIPAVDTTSWRDTESGTFNSVKYIIHVTIVKSIWIKSIFLILVINKNIQSATVWHPAQDSMFMPQKWFIWGRALHLIQLWPKLGLGRVK